VVKTDHEVLMLRQSALLVSKTLAEVGALVRPGITTLELDARAEEFIRDNGGKPGFLGYKGYPKTLCTSVNSQIVHGVPSKAAVLKDGDIISIDCGVELNGYFGDSAYTFEVGEVKESTRKLLKVTRECLFLGIGMAVTKNRIGDISFTIQQHAEKKWIFSSSRVDRARNRYRNARETGCSKSRKTWSGNETSEKHGFMYRTNDKHGKTKNC